MRSPALISPGQLETHGGPFLDDYQFRFYCSPGKQPGQDCNCQITIETWHDPKKQIRTAACSRICCAWIG